MTVLIKESVADQLGLQCFRLPRPVPLGTAWGIGRRVAEEWVNLRLSAPDFLFSAHVVCAIVAPQLCESVILRNTFHVANKLSIDPEVPAVIYKPTGRNLLLPPLFVLRLIPGLTTSDSAIIAANVNYKKKKPVFDNNMSSPNTGTSSVK